MFYVAGCKRKEDPVTNQEQLPTPKKPRLVFTDLQRRTLQAIFKVKLEILLLLMPTRYNVRNIKIKLAREEQN